MDTSILAHRCACPRLARFSSSFAHFPFLLYCSLPSALFISPGFLSLSPPFNTMAGTCCLYHCLISLVQLLASHLRCIYLTQSSPNTQPSPNAHCHPARSADQHPLFLPPYQLRKRCSTCSHPALNTLLECGELPVDAFTTRRSLRRQALPTSQ